MYNELNYFPCPLQYCNILVFSYHQNTSVTIYLYYLYIVTYYLIVTQFEQRFVAWHCFVIGSFQSFSSIDTTLKEGFRLKYHILFMES